MFQNSGKDVKAIPKLLELFNSSKFRGFANYSQTWEFKQ